ncbi:hypothetical protein RBB50_009724 [Rhinocladiella similis]
MEVHLVMMALLALVSKAFAFAAVFFLRLLVVVLLLVFGEVEPRLELFSRLSHFPINPHCVLGVPEPPDVDWVVVSGWFRQMWPQNLVAWMEKRSALACLRRLLDPKLHPFIRQASYTTAGGCLTCNGAGLVPDMVVCLPCGAWVHAKCAQGLEASHGSCVECAKYSLVTGRAQGPTETDVQWGIRKKQERAMRKKQNKRENRAQGRHQKEQKAPKHPHRRWGEPLGIQHPNQKELKNNFYYLLGPDYERQQKAEKQKRQQEEAAARARAKAEGRRLAELIERRSRGGIWRWFESLN